jgi:hypothetical protein
MLGNLAKFRSLKNLLGYEWLDLNPQPWDDEVFVLPPSLTRDMSLIREH